MLTNYFLESIKTSSLYDEDGYLTFNGIVNYVQKKTTDDSEYIQTPVIENRISGYYPFAINTEKQEIDTEEVDTSDEKSIDNVIDSRNLKKLRNEIKDKAKSKIEKSLESIDLPDYECNIISDIEKLNLNGYYQLKKSIVNYVEDNGLTALNQIIYKKIEERDYDNPLYGGFLRVSDRLANRASKTIHYLIDFENEDIDYKFKIYTTDDISKVSFGLGYINYQAKWGLVILKIIFMIDWNGECNKDIKNIKIENIALILRKDSLTAIDKINFDWDSFIENNINEWNTLREEELENYLWY